MFYNPGGLEVFYDYKNDPIEVPPRFVADIHGVVITDSSPVQTIKSTKSLIEEASRITLVRRFALGDVLMLIPIARQLKEEYGDKHISLLTVLSLVESGFIQAFNHEAIDFVGTVESHFGTNSYDVGFLLDGILEYDHYRPEFFHKRRIDIYREFFGLKTGVSPDWGNRGIPSHPKGVVFCSSGRATLKQLLPKTANYIGRKLGKKSRFLLHIGEEHRVSSEELINALNKARVCVTMDTAVLWMAHFSHTPVVFISGPTRGSERLAYHPLYPDGTVEVSLAKEIDCKPCYERMGDCGGSVDCMKIPKERVWELVEKAVEKVAWKTT